MQRISYLRDSADEPTDLDQGIVDTARNRGNVVPTDANGFAYSRTINQVLGIVYLGGQSEGGFFPHGISQAQMSPTQKGKG